MVVGLTDVHRIEELARCQFRPEHVQRRVLPMPGNDLAFTLGLGAAEAPDATGERPLIPQPPPGRIVAPFGHLANRLPNTAHQRASCTYRPGRVENHDRVRTFEAQVECLVVVPISDPRVAGEQRSLFFTPLAVRRCNPARLPEIQIEMNDRQAGPRSKRP